MWNLVNALWSKLGYGDQPPQEDEPEHRFRCFHCRSITGVRLQPAKKHEERVKTVYCGKCGKENSIILTIKRKERNGEIEKRK